MVRLCGDSVFRYVGTVPDGETAGHRLAPPWWRGCVGAPKKKPGFRGGDPRVASAKGHAKKKELAEQRGCVNDGAAGGAADGPQEASQVETGPRQLRQSARLRARVCADAVQGAAVVEPEPLRRLRRPQGLLAEAAPAVGEQDRSAEDLLRWAQGFLQDSAQVDDAEPEVAETVGGKRRRYGEIPSDAWRQFTPTRIDDERCLARVRNLGKGGQCRRRRVAGRDLCYSHACEQTLKYGRVTGPIPEKELRWLLREAEKSKENVARKALRQKASEREREEAQRAGGPEAEAAAPVRGSRQKRHWYTRALMWHFARKRFDKAHGGDLGSLRELAPEEYRACLDEVDAYLKQNKFLREASGAQRVDRDCGPASVSDQGLGVYSMSDAGEIALEDYNGVDGGQVHMWYQREEFERQLSRLGFERSTCNERACVEALQATSLALRSQHLKHMEMEPYAGPQCFPQVFEDARFQANPEKGSRKARAVDQGGAIVDQMAKCWVRCGSPCCGKLRLVQQSALLSLQSEEFLKGVALDAEWKTWLADAEGRYKIAVGADEEATESIDGAAESEAEDDFASIVARAAGDGVNSQLGCVGVPESMEGAAVGAAEDDVASIVASDDDGDSSGWSSCCGPEDRVEGGLECVLEGLGSRGRFDDSDRAALDRLAKGVGPGTPRESPRARAGGSKRRAALSQGPEVRGEGAGVLTFTCDMLQRAARRGEGCSEQVAQQPGWVTMSCDDEDDYEALLKLSCGTEALAEGDAVLLLRGDEEDGGPLAEDWYVRHGRVERLRGKSRAAPNGKVSLRLFAHLRWGAAMQEVQMAPVAESGAKTWRVFRRVGRGRRGAKCGGRRGFSRGQKGVRIKLPRELNAELEKKRYGIHARAKRALAMSIRRGALKARRASAVRNAQLAAVEKSMLKVREENERAMSKCDALAEQVREAPLRDRVRMVPVKHVPLRVSKFDVVLRQAPLRAVQVMHTILSRMVMFRCLVCNERFPTFHPAYVPPAKLDLHLLKRGAGGVAQCCVEVESWTELPPFEDESDGIAKRYTGTCVSCHKDMAAQIGKETSTGEAIVPVPKRSFLNTMDPGWNFPSQLAWLFRQATVTEACLVALDFMQVNFCTVRKTMMHMFRKNTISFPQETGSFFARMGALKQFRVGDRVNSVRGPGSDARDPERPARLWKDASAEEQQRFTQDVHGRMVFAATVRSVCVNGDLVLAYSAGALELGTGVERQENVTARVQMPWHPKQVQENLVILMRRNVGYGEVLEGLEVRWALVAKICRALASFPEVGAGPWREGGDWREPMHKYYDPQLFDVMSEEEILAKYAPKLHKGVYVDAARAEELREQGLHVDVLMECRTGEQLYEAGFKVSVVRSASDRECAAGGSSELAVGSGEVADEVAEEVFEKWLMSAQCSLSQVLLRWWLELEPAGEAEASELKVSEHENAVDLWRRIEAEVRAAVKASADERQRPFGFNAFRAAAVASGGLVTVGSLAAWCRYRVDQDFGRAHDESDEEVEDILRFELCSVEQYFGTEGSGGAMEHGEEVVDAEVEAARVAESVIHGWPAVSSEPVPAADVGRFARAHPLEFPMGIADLHDPRVRAVTPQEWAQHLLRYHTGQFVSGLRGHRVVWAIVNAVLVSEARGKGFAVQRNVMRRMGCRMAGQSPMTRGELRELMGQEEGVRGIVHQLMTVGKDVRATPMHFASKHKELDCAVKHLSWLPPWVERGKGLVGEEARHQFLGSNAEVGDSVGLGRIPSKWWTLNCPYNYVYDIHRLNVDAPKGAEALVSQDEKLRQVRYDFIRDAPDVASFQIALRTELNMKIVMPAVVPHSEKYPYLSMARYENGKNGNPHFHGVSVGAENPRMGRRIVNDAGAEYSDDEVSSVSGEEARRLEAEGAGAAADDGASDSASSVEIVPPPPQPHLEARSKRGRLKSKLRVCSFGGGSDGRGEVGGGGGGAAEEGGEEGAQSLKAMEKAFWECFGEKVSEWNPCYSDEGRVRYSFHRDVGAHNVEVDGEEDLVRGEPIRVNLRAMLDQFFADESAGRPLDLRPLRRLVASLVQVAGRHDRHGEGPPRKNDACARGKPECFYCRYGFPKKLQSRTEERKVKLRKGDREGSWEACFPRNDPLTTSFEAHVLLANMGNIDWRPCLNLWAVVEYICKYATKAPEGSRSMPETLKAAAEEVCKYTREGEPVDFFRKALQKFYAKSIGERDFGMFEAVHLGLRLPTVFPLMPVVSLNTLGSRCMKTFAQMERDGGGEEAAVSWESKVDKFDKRLALVRKQYERAGAHQLAAMEAEVRDLSLYEFYWKYYVRRNRLHAASQTWALMVTPCMAASSAQVFHDRHEAYARMCVVAFWRHMPTTARYDLMRAREVVADGRRWGGTLFQAPALVAGFPLQERCLGIQDLVHAFEGSRTREIRWRANDEAGAREWYVKERRRGAWKYGWSMALMEMLADPVLSEWVPAWVREQYHRWNPDFQESLLKVLREDTAYRMCNRQVLFATRRAMGLKYKKRLSREEQRRAKKVDEDAEGGGESSGDSDGPDQSSEGGGAGDSDENCDPGSEVKKAWHKDAEPRLDDGFDEGAAASESWVGLSAEERLSAAPPAPAATDSVQGSGVGRAGGSRFGGHLNPTDFDWEACNFVPRGCARGMEDALDRWRGVAVRGDVEVMSREQLDPWQKFAYDIVCARSSRSKALRMFLTGTAGTGKSRTVRSFVQARKEMASESKRAELSCKGLEGADLEQQVEEAGEDSCVLAAPTGCASFQMKLGAATIHRVFGVPVGFCGPTRNKRADGFLKRSRRLRAALLYVLDEFSMIGRQMLGKIVFRAQEIFGHPEGQPFPERDFVLAGDPKQAQPVGEEAMYKEGAYTGRGLNKPRKGQAPSGTPAMSALTESGLLFRKSFDDVVVLRDVHRVDFDTSGMSESEGAKYREEAERFLEVTARMADCTWSLKDYEFLQARNKSFLRRTPEGRKELESFEDAPLLVDCRKQRNSGIDGALEINLRELEKLALKSKVPIAALRSYHSYEGAEGDVKAEKMDADEFRGRPHMLHLCEGARVLHTHNEWPEAGLMNGALGNVRGFVWPKGGNPNAVDPERQAPHCVVVEFDDVNLGVEEIAELDEDGKKKVVPRTFFPGLVLGPDKNGKERSLKCVPIFRHAVSAASDDCVTRRQFPLTLAWALTHWKAQGMTLSRARIRLSSTTARQPGIGFVAVSRVKHVRHLVFEEDLPSWDVFQEAQYKPNFRSRRRFELRLLAQASTTLRRYGFCEADPWTREDAEVAARLLQGLQAVGDDRRRRQGKQGDDDAWLWEEETPCLATLMLEQVARVVSGMSAAEGERVQKVGERLLGPLHVVRVKEVLGCLIPKELHWRLDGKKPKGKPGSDLGRAGVYVHAGSWRVDVVEEQELFEGRLLKGMLEFCLIVLRRMCQKLALPVAIGSHALGMAIAAAADVTGLRLAVQDLKHWPEIAASMRTAREALFPIILEDSRVLRKCVLLCVRAGKDEESLLMASSLRVHVGDHLARKSLGRELKQKVVGLVRSIGGVVESEKVEVVVDPGFPEIDMDYDVGVAVLGLLVARVAEVAEGVGLPVSSKSFVQDAAAGLKTCFGYLRAEVGRRGHRDALKVLEEPAVCKRVLRLLCGSGSDAAAGADEVSFGARGGSSQLVPASTRMALKVLTWNIAGASMSRQAPSSFTPLDKLPLIVNELLGRWLPDVFALQECAEESALPGLADVYALVGAAYVEVQRAYVHLYAKKELGMELVAKRGQWPGVLGRVMVEGELVDFAALHLQPGEGGAEERKRQLTAVAAECSSAARVLLGDFNVRAEEDRALLKSTGYRNASYSGSSWDPKIVQYDEQLKTYRGHGHAFDRIFFTGACWAESFLVGRARHFSEGCGFYVSDHFGLMCVLDVAAVYRRVLGSPRGKSRLADWPDGGGVGEDGGGAPGKGGGSSAELLQFGREFLANSPDESDEGGGGDLDVRGSAAGEAPSGGGDPAAEPVRSAAQFPANLPDEVDGGRGVDLGVAGSAAGGAPSKGGDSKEDLLSFARQFLANASDESDEEGDRALGVPGSAAGGAPSKGGDSAEELLKFARTFLANSPDEPDEEVDRDVGVGGSARALREQRDFRRGLCVRDRDELCAREAADLKLRERLGRQAFLTQKAQQAFVIDQRRSTQQLAAAKRAIKDAREARKELWTAAFGKESLFHESVAGRFQRPAEKPCAASELSLPGCEGLSGATASVDVLRGLCRSRGPTCYVIVVCQILLRLPSLIAWLGWHEQCCAAGEACAACLLHRTRLQFGRQALPELLLHRASVEEVFGDALHHEPFAFCGAVLEAMRRTENLAGRCAVWPGVGVVGEVFATHVDRLFAFVEERCLRCKACGAGRVQYERRTQLHLPAPRDHACNRSLYDAYLEYCAPNGGVTASCPRCCTEQPHVAQRRLATMPGVLLVQVRRASVAGALARYPFCVDDQTSLPDLGPMSLAAIVFHFGRGRETGHYTCACRGPDGGFWYFDDAREPVAVRSVLGFFEKNVDAVVYTKPGFVGPRLDTLVAGGAGARDAGRPADDVEAVRKHLVALRGPSAVASLQPGASELKGGGERAEALKDLRVFADRLWGERSFRSLLFDDPTYAEELVAGLPEPLSGNALDFWYFVDGCREHALVSADFEGMWNEEAPAPETLLKRRGGAVSGAGRAEELCARTVASATARRRRREMEAKAALLSKVAAGTVVGGAGARGAARVAAAGFDGGSLAAGSSASRTVHAGAGAHAGPRGSGHVVGGAVQNASGRVDSRGRGVPATGAASVAALRSRSQRTGEARAAILSTPLCKKLSDLRLDGDVMNALLAEMQARFGEDVAWELAGAEWLLAWRRWETFAEEVHVAAGSWSEGFLVVHVQRLMEEFLFALRRVVVAQERGPQRSNEEALHGLRAFGLERGVGEVWGENDCLADSLLQLLIFHGVVAEGVVRKTACLANRVRLEAQEDLVPRDIDGNVDLGGFLQHHRHAEPTAEFFFEWYACSEAVLPSAGFRLVVHARSDDDQHPPDELLICEGCGGRPGPPLDCHLFNRTGRVHEGYHYDPLLPLPLVAEVVDVTEEASADASEGEDTPGREGNGDGASDRRASPGGFADLPGVAVASSSDAGCGCPAGVASAVEPVVREAHLGEYCVDPELVRGDGGGDLELEVPSESEAVEGRLLSGQSAPESRGTVVSSVRVLRRSRADLPDPVGCNPGGPCAAEPQDVVMAASGVDSGRGREESAEKPVSRRTLQRHAAIGCDFDVAPLVAAVSRLRLGCVSVENSVEGVVAMSAPGAEMNAVSAGAAPAQAALPRDRFEEGVREAKCRAGAASSGAAGSEAGTQTQGGGKGKGRGKSGGRVQASLPTVAGPVASGGDGVVHTSAPRSELLGWECYTPEPVNVGRCMARTWADGRGGQCTRAPTASTDLCRMHVKQMGCAAWLGKVDGPIPDVKLEEFRRKGTPRVLSGAGAVPDEQLKASGRAQAKGKSAAGSSAGRVKR